MSSVNDPLRPRDPEVLGPFRLRARLSEHDAGLVLAGADGNGAEAQVVVLHPAAADDSAARDRFEAAVGALARRGRVPSAGPRDPVAWAAVAGGALEDAVALLDAVALTSGDGGGPAFAPHWADVPDKGWALPDPVPDASAGRRPARRGALVVGLAVVVVSVLLLLVVWAAFSLSGPGLRRSETGSGQAAEPTVPAPLPSSPRRTPPRQKGKDGPPGPVAGPTFGKDEDTYRMKPEGLPFVFDAPGTWGCMVSDEAPFVSRWVCADDDDLGGAGGLVAVQECPKPCRNDERAALREELALESGDWRRTDATTMYAEVEGTDDEGGRILRVAMSHVFGDGGRRPDSGVAVVLTGPPDQKRTMQKLVNEIRTRSG